MNLPEAELRDRYVKQGRSIEPRLKLSILLEPYLRHPKRRQDMEQVKANIAWRKSQAFQAEVNGRRKANKL